jgi:uncharacterized protein
VAYVRRLIETRLERLLADVPAVLLTGPRACGKTTTARRYAGSVIHLDDPAVGGVFRQAPDVALRDLSRPVLLDEWQAAPEVIGAIKRVVDEDPRAGQFILTGSASTDLAGPTWPGTGRIIRLAMAGLTEREVEGRVDGPSFVDSILDDPERLDVATTLDVADYIDLALRSGFPEPALRQQAATRADWLDSYLDECFARDIPALRAVRDPTRLRRLFVAFATNTAGVVEEKTLHEAARLDRKTALVYESLFEAVGITEQVPSFTSNRLKRLVERPKRYVTDCGLVGAALALDRGSTLRDGNALGRLIDTFVAAQLRGELVRSASPRARLRHLRAEAGRHEIDIVVDLGPRGVVAIEVKAAGAPTNHDARHLRWFQAEVTDKPVVAAVLHTGSNAYALQDGVLALPIASIWRTRA